MIVKHFAYSQKTFLFCIYSDIVLIMEHYSIKTKKGIEKKMKREKTRRGTEREMGTRKKRLNLERVPRSR